MTRPNTILLWICFYIFNLHHSNKIWKTYWSVKKRQKARRKHSAELKVFPGNAPDGRESKRQFIRYYTYMRTFVAGWQRWHATLRRDFAVNLKSPRSDTYDNKLQLYIMKNRARILICILSEKDIGDMVDDTTDDSSESPHIHIPSVGSHLCGCDDLESREYIVRNVRVNVWSCTCHYVRALSIDSVR